MIKDKPVSLRERFFRFLEGRDEGRILFFPDITDWYKARRTPPGRRQPYEPGQIIYDDDPFHANDYSMPPDFRDWTLLDFYRRFGWGCPIHLYEWRDDRADGYHKDVSFDGRRETTTITTPVGAVRQVRTMAADGSFCITEHYAKTTGDLGVLVWAARHTTIEVRHDRVAKALTALDDFGVIDIPVGRSPFGCFIHDAMGLMNAVYALQDASSAVEAFLEGMAEPFFGLIQAASSTQAKVVIISDHADEYLISPPFYRKYCIPIYRQACEILHRAGKIVSTHVDGNLQGHLSLLPETGFDLLDGCTPAPMSNYTVEQLSLALSSGLKAYCGIPASLFVTNRPDEEILDWAGTIEREGRGRMILNVGDILSPEGNIEQVIKVGTWVGCKRVK